MLAHLKAKGRSLVQGSAAAGEKKKEEGTSGFQQTNNNAQQQQQPQRRDSSHLYENEATQMTCEMLCSLSSSCSPPGGASSKASVSSNGYSSCRGSFDCPPSPSATSPSSMMFSGTEEKRNSSTGGGSLGCSKQHQLPMFLSKTYHMIDRCDGTIATWSESGDNFVVKNVEKFASAVLPLYFKHSNFSSFARQLNFYGFRKLRTDPILTSDVDPRTACYVRFYHEKFQKDRPELLHQIKRATKSDQQSKDDVESLKAEVSRLKDCMSQWQTETDRKLTELAYENNRRITCLSAEYDKLATVVQELLTTVASGKQSIKSTGIINNNNNNNNHNSSTNSNMNVSSIHHNLTGSMTEHGGSNTNNAAATALMDHVQHSEKTFANTMMNPPPAIASSNMEGSMPAPTSTSSVSLLSMAVSLQQKPPQQHSKAPRQYQQPPLPHHHQQQQQKSQQRSDDLMHSLSTVAAMSLQQNHHPLRPQGDARTALGKRGAEDETPSEHIPIHSRARNE